MPTLQSLAIQHFRNIESVDFRPGPGLNVIYGDNGSGKTSLLEAAYLLGLARSFRSTSSRPLIQEGHNEAYVAGKLSNGLTMGIKKTLTGKQEIKVGGSKASSAAALAREIPMLLVNTDTFSVLDGSPKMRRGFMDWGVFHVERGFLENWRQMATALKNRNVAIKNNGANAEVAPWTQALVNFGELITEERAIYIQELEEPLRNALQALSPTLSDQHLELEYLRGWPEGLSLEQALRDSLTKDRRYGYTTLGPHRADLRIRLDGVPVQDRLSRGQQKLLICALKLAQAQLLKDKRGQQCLFLVDDLPAELDEANRTRLCELLISQKQQVFITCIESGQLDFLLKMDSEIGLFHVKHGRISVQ